MNHYKYLVEEEGRGVWSKKRKRFTSMEASAWFVGVMLDQLQRAEGAWDRGDHLVYENEEFRSVVNIWETISDMHLNSLKRICNTGYYGNAYALRYLHRRFPEYLKRSAKLIVAKYKGDVRNIWNGVKAEKIDLLYDRLIEFPGIGKMLARMGQFDLVRTYGVGGGEENKSKMRVKPDEHVRRVAYRSDLISTKKVTIATRELDSLQLDSPADFDLAVWDIGREFCKLKNPYCNECPLDKVCVKRLN